MAKRSSEPTRFALALGVASAACVATWWTGCFYSVRDLAPTEQGGDGSSFDAGPDGGTNTGGTASAGSGDGGSCAGSAAACGYRQRCSDMALVPHVFVGGQLGPYALVADRSYVFWSDRNPGAPTAGRIRRREVAGTATTTDLAMGQADPGALALDAGFVYWVTSDGNVLRSAREPASTDAGQAAPEPIATGQRTPSGIVVDATYVYWLNRVGNNLSRREKEAPRGAVTPLASTQPKPVFLAEDADSLSWTTSSGFVETAAKSGGATTELVTPDDLSTLLGADALQSFDVAGIAVDPVWVYFRARGLRIAPVKTDTGKLLRVQKDGTGLELLFDGPSGAVSFLTSDSPFLYFTTGNLSGDVWRVKNDGSEALLMSCQAEATPTGIVVTASRAYWTNQTGATLTWAPK